MSNEKIIEELLWIAYQHNLGIQLAELAGDYIKKNSMPRMEAYEKAFHELGLVHN